jgi:hypothetical protein
MDDGTAYVAIGGAMSSTGLSAAVVSETHHLRRMVRDHAGKIDACQDGLIKLISKKTGQHISKLELRLVVTEGPKGLLLGVREEQTGFEL